MQQQEGFIAANAVHVRLPVRRVGEDVGTAWVRRAVGITVCAASDRPQASGEKAMVVRTLADRAATSSRVALGMIGTRLQFETSTLCHAISRMPGQAVLTPVPEATSKSQAEPSS